MASATWSTQPATGDWNIAAHWYPAEVPTDTATFGASTQTTITFSKTGASVGAIEFSADAAAYTFQLGTSTTPSLSVGGTGISNLAAGPQQFVVAATSTGYTNAQLQFSGSASAGGSNVLYSVGPVTPAGYGGGVIGFVDQASAGSACFTVRTGAGAPPASGSTVGGEVSFSDTATASTATFTVYGSTSTANGGDTFGNVVFHNSSTAAHGTFKNIGGTLPGCDGGNTQFYDTATAAQGIFVNLGGTVGGANGGDVAFDGTAGAGSGHFINQAAPVAGGYGGVTSFNNNGPTLSSGGASAGSATIINCGAEQAAVGGGGHTSFSAAYGWPTADQATIINQGSTLATSSCAGHTIFSSPHGQSFYPTAGGATIRNLGAPGPGGVGGYTQFTVYNATTTPNYPRAGSALLINEGGDGENAPGGSTRFSANASAESATLIAYGGSNGGQGGQILFAAESEGDAASVTLSGNGTLSLATHDGALTLSCLTAQGGIITTQLGSYPTTLAVSSTLSVPAAPVTFQLVAGTGCQPGVRYPILTAPQVGTLPASSFAAIAPAGQTATLSSEGNTLYVTLN